MIATQGSASAADRWCRRCAPFPPHGRYRAGPSLGCCAGASHNSVVPPGLTRHPLLPRAQDAPKPIGRICSTVLDSSTALDSLTTLISAAGIVSAAAIAELVSDSVALSLFFQRSLLPSPASAPRASSRWSASSFDAYASAGVNERARSGCQRRLRGAIWRRSDR